MPFIMTHLEIAKGIYTNTRFVNNPSQFYLGSISPDCVHIRNHYDSTMKIISHYCTKDTRWGECTDNALWRKNALAALHSYRDSDDFDFYFGYFIHILADTLDNEKIYMPFKEKYAQLGLPTEDRGKAFYNDKSQNDFALYKRCGWREEAWTLLQKSSGVAVADIVTADEVDAFKEMTLHQYDCGESSFHDPIRYFTLQDNLAFIQSSIPDIIKLLAL